MKQIFRNIGSGIWRWFVPERSSFYDRGLLALTFTLMGIGLMMVASASIKEGPGGDMFYYTKRHLIFLILCMGCGVVTLYVPIEKWKAWSSKLLIGALVITSYSIHYTKLYETFGNIRTDLYCCFCTRIAQRLCIRIDSHKVDTFNIFSQHMFNGVT